MTDPFDHWEQELEDLRDEISIEFGVNETKLGCLVKTLVYTVPFFVGLVTITWFIYKLVWGLLT